jgi:hypothetical protein
VERLVRRADRQPQERYVLRQRNATFRANSRIEYLAHRPPFKATIDSIVKKRLRRSLNESYE